MREPLLHARRIVIKVGTRVATEGDNAFSVEVIGTLVRQIAALQSEEGRPAGAGALLHHRELGRHCTGAEPPGLATRPKELDLLQAAAAMGQSRLMHAYEHEFEAVRTETAQILLTSEDIRSRTRYLNIRNTIFTLWSFGAVPIVNENDTVSFDEISFRGQRHHLRAHRQHAGRGPARDAHGHRRRLRQEPEAARRRARAAHRGEGDGERAGRRGGKGLCFLLGRHGVEDPGRGYRHAQRRRGGDRARGGVDLPGILAGREIGTWFVPALRRMKGRKKWMAFNPRTDGAIVVDRGAERAILEQGRSLLPAGVKGIRGAFAMGSVISILDEDGREVARGLSNFSSDDLEKIRGMNTKRIPEVLGVEAYFDEVVHRDNLVIVAKGD